MLPQPSVAAASPKAPLGLLQGKYVLGDCIGAGGMGRVFRAHQPALQRVVAIKIMHSTLAENPHVVRHFHTEARAAAGIAHPNSVAVLDYGETEDGIPFLVMELVEGRSLAQLVRDEAPLDPARAIAIVLQVLGALEEAHRTGVVHADVKSDNVLVETRRDGSDRAKLVDFGLARIAREPIFFDDVDVISGTPEYMAPEIIAGAPPSRASDIYAAMRRARSSTSCSPRRRRSRVARTTRSWSATRTTCWCHRRFACPSSRSRRMSTARSSPRWPRIRRTASAARRHSPTRSPQWPPRQVIGSNRARSVRPSTRSIR
jgi:serine/threonine protein kinase